MRSRAGALGDDSPAVRILMVDNRTIMREALALLVQQDPAMQVVGHASAMEEAIDLDVVADVVLTEYELPDAEGAELVRRLVDRYPDAGILVLSTLGHPSKVEEAVAAGAHGYVLETADASQLRDGIRAVARGHTYLQPEIGIEIARWRITPPPPDPTPPKHPLSAKELEVLRLLALGYTNHEIAKLMAISLRTVESHRARIQQKLDRHTRWELVQYAHQIGLFGAPATNGE